MAKYTTTFSNTATVKVPYHFICNYCGKRNDKVQEITGETNRTVSGVHSGGVSPGMEREFNAAVKDDLVSKIKSIDSKIKDYGEGLKDGRTFSYSFLLSELKGEHPDHIGFDMLSDATCIHCGKKQAWGMPPATGAMLSGCLTFSLGFIFSILAILLAFRFSDSLGVAAFAISVIGYLTLSYILPKRKIKANQVKIAAEPNDPDKLPVLDIDLGFGEQPQRQEDKAPAAEPVAAEPINAKPANDTGVTGILLGESVKNLLTLYQRAPEGFLKSQAREVRTIGEDLNRAGGMDLMLKAHEMFAARNPQMARNLEIVWDGIGNWMG